MKRINLWSGPRNISTATMYAFAQRQDVTVFDEPLYAHYLSKTPAYEYHPGAAEVLETQENNGKKVVEMMMGNHSTEIVFFKHMAHHLIELDWSFMEDCINVILTRNPKEMLPSYNEQVETPSLYDVGYDSQLKILNYLQSKGKKVIVMEAKQVLLNPRKVLSELCKQLEIPFDKAMLEWKAGARKEDGCWAKYWYKSVHKSTGFAPYKPKTKPFPERLKSLLVECQPYYEQLERLAIKA
ncbi:MAG: sulfotransferase family protein [Saprospiraceae bacterium]